MKYSVELEKKSTRVKHTVFYISVRCQTYKTKQPHMNMVKLEEILITKFRIIGGFSGLDNVLFLKLYGSFSTL